MRKVIIAGNWKMNKGMDETMNFVKAVVSKLNTMQMNRVIPLIAPAYPFLAEVLLGSEGSALQVAAQDVSANPDGAFTGEVSVNMLSSLGLKYCIIGHSERRQYHNETDAGVRTKLLKLFEQKITPIVCVGESLKQRDAGQTNEVVLAQLCGCLHEIEFISGNEIIIAYEPVWAIGTGRTATPEQAQEVHSLIRSWLQKHLGDTVAENMCILYGGSVKPDNIKELLSCEDIDGGLIGGASLKEADFLEMVRIGSES